MGRPRPLLAAALGMLSPGLGHLYLREWARAVVWFVLAVGTAIIVFPEQATAGVTAVDPVTWIEAGRQATTEASTVGLALVASVLAFSVADAYGVAMANVQQARRERAAAAGEPAVACPHCGRELDPDLEFCHWCTTRLETGGDDGIQNP